MLEQLPAGSVVDGELVLYSSGPCDFVEFVRRIRSRPSLAAATLVVFEALALAGRDLRGLPYRKRLRRLLANATGVDAR